jgi:MraZ protein
VGQSVASAPSVSREMFRGQFVHTIDSKGRVSLPARFREALRSELRGRCILTPAPFDPCLHLHPLPAWEKLEMKIAELPALDRNIVRFRRLYVSAAIECELDRAGRVLVPPHLRAYAELQRDVLWAGMVTSVELWAKERWDAALAMTPKQQAAFRRAITEQFRI